MEIEQAIILALSEPRIYTKLRTEARKIRHQHEKTLSNEAFEEALKRLRDEKIVLRREINGRDVEYSLNHDSSSVVRYVIFASDKIDKKIELLEKFTKSIERKSDEIDKGRKTMIEMGLEDIVKEDKVQHFVVQEYQAFIMELMKFTLSSQKLSFFFTSKIWGTKYPARKHQLQRQKRFSDIIDRLAKSSIKLDKDSAFSVHTIIRKELTDETLLNDLNSERFQKLLTTPPEINYYESLS